LREKKETDKRAIVSAATHSTLMFPAFTTFDHFAISSPMKRLNSSGVECAGSTPSARSRV
jgi:hypothetical protein